MYFKIKKQIGSHLVIKDTWSDFERRLVLNTIWDEEILKKLSIWKDIALFFNDYVKNDKISIARFISEEIREIKDRSYY